MKDRGTLLAELLNVAPGYVTAVTIEPGGSQGGLDYGASVYEVVVLDDAVVAYRYSDDSVNGAWEIGAPDDVIDAVVERLDVLEDIEDDVLEDIEDDVLEDIEDIE